jgi:hypothetical protein
MQSGLFYDNLCPALNKVRIRNAHLKVSPTLRVHMNNSMRDNEATITEKMPSKGLGRASIQPIHQISVPVISGHSEQLQE